MICSRCREENRQGARFCRACGAPLATLCSSCGANVDAGSKFCDRCGAVLEASPAPPPVPTPAAGAPDNTGARHKPRPPAEAERRQLTVMFCDLVGSTELAARLDPERLRDVVRSYQGVCDTVIGQLHGNVAQYLGDGLLVYCP
jgi:double zinc ribbon protein